MRLSVVFLSILLACTEIGTPVSEMKEYDGPLRSAEDVEMYYSEESEKKIKMKAPVLYELKGGDREFPEGFFLEFYDEKGALSSTLSSNYAFYSKEEDIWKATGDVVVKSFEKNQQLNSEELFWKPDKEKIHTNKFVTIRFGNEVIYGTGLESNQTFTDYEIKNPKGEFEVN